jgi:hypothetical protein
MEVLFLYFFTSAADGNDCSVASPGHFILGKDSLYLQKMRLSGPRASLHTLAKRKNTLTLATYAATIPPVYSL